MLGPSELTGYQSGGKVIYQIDSKPRKEGKECPGKKTRFLEVVGSNPFASK